MGGESIVKYRNHSHVGPNYLDVVGGTKYFAQSLIYFFFLFTFCLNNHSFVVLVFVGIVVDRSLIFLNENKVKGRV